MLASHETHEFLSAGLKRAEMNWNHAKSPTEVERWSQEMDRWEAKLDELRSPEQNDYDAMMEGDLDPDVYTARWGASRGA